MNMELELAESSRLGVRLLQVKTNGHTDNGDSTRKRLNPEGVDFKSLWISLWYLANS